MANSNAKGRRKRPSGVWMQHRVLISQNWRSMSTKAVKLTMDVAAQYKGNNNGDLCATWSHMEGCGWRSKSQLDDALDEALHYGMLQMTRQGGRHKCSLYALTWEAIDDCKGKLDVASTAVASNAWEASCPPYVPKRKRKLKALPLMSGQCAPTIGSIRKAGCKYGG